uniref:Uncharacterized protein n=1 Tax=Caenorhabditis japonica TaxID=281687 RepID=A0A8R1HX93_CAEJA
MNLHVLMNHMIILEHGEFLINRKSPKRKRAAEEFPEKFSAHVQPVEIQSPPSKISISQSSLTSDETPPNIQQILALFSQNATEENNEKRGIKMLVDNEFLPTSSSSKNPSSTEEFQTEEVQGMNDVVAQLIAPLGSELNLSEVVDEFIERLKPMKQLGFIRPHKTVYCIVCLKYVKSYHECNWKHSSAEDRVAEMWYRRFGSQKPVGKNQLMREFLEIKAWIQEEEGFRQVLNK